MANDNDKNDNHEESTSPLSKQVEEKEDVKKTIKSTDAEANTVTVSPPTKTPIPRPENIVRSDWTANGLPLRHESVVDEPMGRDHWDSSLFACVKCNEFCSSDIEVCFLASVAPCVLYGSNVERLGYGHRTFVKHCLSYCGLCLIGQITLGSNFFVPWFTYTNRTAIRRKFNLEGSCEAIDRSYGCCGSFLEDEVRLKQSECVCDLVTHILCHLCALCQEGRELRRRLPHPAFNAQPLTVMIPPVEQTMGRAA